MGTNVSRTEHPNATAKALGVSVQTLSRYAREGLVPFDLTPKGHRRYDTAEVVESLRTPAVDRKSTRLNSSHWE